MVEWTVLIEGNLQVDWALVHPEDPHEHRAIQSGELVAFRSPITGMYAGYSGAFQDDVSS